MVMSDVNVARDNRNQIVAAQQVGRYAKAHVAEPLAEQKEAVRSFDERSHWRRADRPEIRADELWMTRRKDPAAQKRGGHRNSHALGEANHLVDELEAMRFDPDNENGPFRLRQAIDDFGGRLGDRTVVHWQLDFAETRRDWNV